MSDLMTPKQILFSLFGIASFSSFLYFFSRTSAKTINSHTERLLLISKLRSQKEEIERELEWLLSEEKTYVENFEDENERNQDYSLPINDPALDNLKRTPSKIFIVKENQKMKDKILLLGDYKGLQEKDYEENFSIHIKNKEELKAKLKKMKEDGIEDLQIVSDFDLTTTCFNVNKTHCDSLFGTFRTTNHVSHVFKKTMESLHLCYAPIEVDLKIDIEDKRRLLKEWYDAVRMCFLNENLNIEKCMAVLNDANLAVRYGYREFLTICKVMNLPYYMISGGITEMLQTIIAKAIDIKNYQNFFTFSNNMIFDTTGKLIDMDMKVYATTKFGILDARKFQFKKNTLLFGDLITDYEMASKMGDQNLVAVGFLEENKKEFLEEYLKKFDIVILGDGDFLIHDKILRTVGSIEENPFFREKIFSNKSFEEFREIIESIEKH